MDGCVVSLLEFGLELVDDVVQFLVLEVHAMELDDAVLPVMEGTVVQVPASLAPPSTLELSPEVLILLDQYGLLLHHHEVVSVHPLVHLPQPPQLILQVHDIVHQSPPFIQPHALVGASVGQSFLQLLHDLVQLIVLESHHIHLIVLIIELFLASGCLLLEFMDFALGLLEGSEVLGFELGQSLLVESGLLLEFLSQCRREFYLHIFDSILEGLALRDVGSSGILNG